MKRFRVQGAVSTGLLVCSVLLVACSLVGPEPTGTQSVAHWLSLGNRHLLQEAPQEAVLAYRKALDRDDALAPAWLGLASGYRALGEYPAAEQAFAEAIRLDRTERSRHALARYRAEQGRLAEAARLLERVLSAVDYGGRNRALQDRAEIALLQQDWTLARTCWQHLARRVPGHALADWHLDRLNELQALRPVDVTLADCR